jgi:hypothetical protein
MSKTIQKPLACRNAHCGAMCSPADAEFSRSNPSKCYNYERRDDLYMVKSIPLDKVKQAREEIKQLPITDTAIKLVIEILDKLIESEET